MRTLINQEHTGSAFRNRLPVSELVGGTLKPRSRRPTSHINKNKLANFGALSFNKVSKCISAYACKRRQRKLSYQVYFYRRAVFVQKHVLKELKEISFQKKRIRQKKLPIQLSQKLMIEKLLKHF
ncbi:uncharacterized protein LOC111619391 [Centruroides sculpturatus]|uniref:uncharacterized protein LOC111619391 n=1 Tax=Centruroides sculpturatus TaxID=218467 RepID=UPI000C6D40E2|nr:uncharacterized protein LOC111619391 [Centruroides sculpturatus]